MDGCCIKAENVSKKFTVSSGGSTLKDKVLFRKKASCRSNCVLDGINLEIKKGEQVGLIGKNGCGKSTLLKLFSKIIYPDSGCITVSGRVSSLLELGAGFHPDFSGRENIYFNGAVLGLSKSEISQRLDDIISFSELSKFIDSPVRTYSSGMYMRLAFSIAVSSSAEILLIDEILAVGDAAFQEKCQRKIEELKNSGTTLVIVSHDESAIKRLCGRAVYLKDGKIAADASPDEAFEIYKNSD